MLGDVDQHKDRIMSCEMARMPWVTHEGPIVVEAIQADRNTRPSLWIWYNPDSFKIDWENQEISKKYRFQKLCQEILIDRPTLKDGFQILYMYYDLDEYPNLKILLEDDEYPGWFNAFVIWYWIHIHECGELIIALIWSLEIENIELSKEKLL